MAENNRVGGALETLGKEKKFKALKFKAKAKAGRGSIDPAFVKELLTDEENWDKMGEELESMGDDRDTLTKHFNDTIGDDIGDALFGEERDSA